MSLLVFVAVMALVFLAAYYTYGTFLTRFLKLRSDVRTPAVEMRDDVDYVPISPRFLLGQHFSAIAAAGPIVGPILAAMYFGWGPALLWIVVGAIFIGGVHDFGALTASIRHKARSVPELVKEHVGRRSHIIFLIFLWLTLVYIIVVFTDMTAQSFVGAVSLAPTDTAGGQAGAAVTVSGGGIATSSLLYLAIPVAMGLVMRYARLPLAWATVIFLPLVAIAIWGGQYIPFSVEDVLDVSPAKAQKIWDVALLGYCIVASLVPMWLLLQPRGHLGGLFLYAALAAAGVGLLLGGHHSQFPAFLKSEDGGMRWTAPNGDMMFPFLFITIACGACSGFHAIVAAGTSSKQLRLETDAKVVGYGAMLLEGLVAVVALACVMMLTPAAAAGKSPNAIYASGLGRFMETIGVPLSFGVAFGLMAFTTFVYDTLDVCTRLGRYVIQELTGISDWRGKALGTILTGTVPLFFLMQAPVGPDGKPVAAWKAFWTVFGASNQLLAALTLLAITIWLVRSNKAWWAGLVSGIPMLWMYAMSLWGLGVIAARGFRGVGHFAVPYVSLVLIALALWMLVEALGALMRRAGAAQQAVGEPAGD